MEIVKESVLLATTPLNESMDNKIHCFKTGQPCAEGKDLLAEEMKKLGLEKIEDPFASDEDEDEDAANEAFIIEDPISSEPGSSEDE